MSRAVIDDSFANSEENIMRIAIPPLLNSKKGTQKLRQNCHAGVCVFLVFPVRGVGILVFHNNIFRRTCRNIPEFRSRQQRKRTAQTGTAGRQVPTRPSRDTLANLMHRLLLARFETARHADVLQHLPSDTVDT